MADLFEGFGGPAFPTTGGGDDLFGDFVPVTPGEEASPGRSYIGAKARQGALDLGAIGAGLVAGAAEIGPSMTLPPVGMLMKQFTGQEGFVASKRALMEQFKNDPEGFKAAWASPLYAAHRAAEDLANRAQVVGANLNDEGKAVAGQSYDPWSGKPTAGVTRLAGDVLASAPSAIGSAASIALATRNPVAGAAVGGVIEGTIGGTAQRQQVRQSLEAVAPEKWAVVPEYQKLIAAGWHPDMARNELIEKASQQSSIETGVATGLISALGGHILGRATQGLNPGVAGRIGLGFGTEAIPESIQSGVEQVSQNLAERRTIDPGKDPYEGTRESMFAGFVVGGAVGAAANAALGRQQRAKEHIATTQTLGVNPDTLPDSRPLPPIAARIAEVARAAGVDPAVAVMTASMESNFNPGIVNSIGATGLFQFLDGAMKTYGVTREQLLADPELQIQTGVRMLADAQRVVTSAMGREPLPHEIYMAQLFGHGGVRAWLAADPNARTLDVVSGYEKRPDVALATLTGNGFTADMTVGQVIDILRRKTSAHLGRPIGEGEIPTGADLSRLRSAPMADLDPKADADLSLDELLPPVPQEVLDKAALAPEIGKQGDNVETTNIVREAEVVEAEALNPQAFKLPDALRTTPARFKSWNINFRDDVTHALYGADSAGPEGQLYRDWLVNEVGMQTDEIKRLSNLVFQASENARRAADSAVARGINVTKLNIPTLDQITAGAAPKADVGLSEDARETRESTPNPNHAKKREARPVIFGPGPGPGNLQALATHSLTPGQVVTAGYPNDHASSGYMEAVHKTVQKLISMFAPSARVIIFHETRGDAVAGYKRLGNGYYAIIPRNLTRVETVGRGIYNTTAKLQAGFSLLHEVGHLIIDHHFMRGLSESQQHAINTLPPDGYFEEKFLASLPKDIGAILREYNEKKRSFLENSKATGEDFIKGWMSPWKIAHGLGQATVEGGARRWANSKVGQGSSRLDAKTFAMNLHSRWDTLSVHEYLAEQFARYGYRKALLEKTALGATEWFKRTLDGLRKAFTQAKVDKTIGGGTTFEGWLQRLTENAKPARGKATPIPRISLADMRTDSAYDTVTHDQILFRPGIPEATRREAIELVQYGQPETAREVVERAKGSPEITRWDGDVPGFDSLDDAAKNLDKLPAMRSATRTWLATANRIWARTSAAVLDIRQRAAVNLDVAGLFHISNALTGIKSYSGRLQRPAIEVAKKWAALDKNQTGGLQELMEIEWRANRHLAKLEVVDGRMQFVPTQEFADALAKGGLTEATGRLMLDIKDQYLHRINVLHHALRRQMMEKMADALPERRPYYQEQIRRLAQAFKTIRNQPFHPQTRFGEHFLEVKRGGDVVHVESFDSESARDNAMLKLRQNTKGYSFTPFRVDSRVAVMRTLPIEVLDSVGFDGTLTPRQRRELMRTLDYAETNPKLRKYSPELGRITGASRDGLRVFADFMSNDATLLAKMAYKSEFDTGLEMIESDLAAAKANMDLDQTSRLQGLLNAARKDVAQVMNPAAEWHMVRSFIVFHDLWASIKTAVANITDVTKTWARVSKVLGDISGAKVFGKSMYDSAADMLVKGMADVASGPPSQWKGLNFEERAAMERAIDEGHIDETMAATMAGLGSGGVLQRLSMPTAGRLLDRVMRGGMWPMQQIEMFSRRVAFLSTFRAYRLQGISAVEAYPLALQDLHLIGGDNSIQNRAEMLRGKKGLALIYYNYTRYTMFAMGGGLTKSRVQREELGVVPPSKGYGSETTRLWLAYAALGGLMGLPGAEDLDKLLEVASRTVFGQRFSLREHAF